MVRHYLGGRRRPCQRNSRQGLHDPCTSQPQYLCNLRDDFAFLEKVAVRCVGAVYSHWLGSPPVLVDASACGWVQRRRFYWLVASREVWRSTSICLTTGPGCPWMQVVFQVCNGQVRIGKKHLRPKLYTFRMATPF